MEFWQRLRGRIPSTWKQNIRSWTQDLIRRMPVLSSLRAKLIVPYVLLTLSIALLGVFIITRLVAGSFQERFGNQLIEAGRVTADGIVRKEQDKRWRDWVSIWANYNRGLGTTREFIIDSLKGVGIEPSDVPPQVQF